MEAMEITFEDVYKISAAIIGPLVAAVVYMYLVNRRDSKKSSVEIRELYKTFIQEQKENLRNVTSVITDNKNAVEKLSEAVSKNTEAISHNSRIVDKLFDKITDATKR